MAIRNESQPLAGTQTASLRTSIDQVAKDLQTAFPGIEGFSRTDVFRMRAFSRSYQRIPLDIIHKI